MLSHRVFGYCGIAFGLFLVALGVAQVVSGQVWQLPGRRGGHIRPIGEGLLDVGYLIAGGWWIGLGLLFVLLSLFALRSAREDRLQADEAYGGRVFVLDMDDLGLAMFETAPDAVRSCEGIDVEGDGYRFFTDDGSPLQARFSTPNERGAFTVRSGSYVLCLADPAVRPSLHALLSNVAYVEGGGFRSVGDVRRYLKKALSKELAKGG